MPPKKPTAVAPKRRRRSIVDETAEVTPYVPSDDDAIFDIPDNVTFPDVGVEAVVEIDDTELDADDIGAEEDGPLVKAAKTGDRRLLLIAMRDRLAYMLEKTDSGRDCAAIARNLNIVSKELDTMEDPEKIDEDPVEQMRRMVADKQAEE